MDAWTNHEWKKRWVRAAEATWNTPWEMSPLTLYDNLPKHQATALMLLRTEVIGPGSKRLAGLHTCTGYPPTLRLRLACTDCPPCLVALSKIRAADRATGSEDLRSILTHVASAQAAARWFVRCGVLDQFRVAHEVELEDISEYAPFRALLT